MHTRVGWQFVFSGLALLLLCWVARRRKWLPENVRGMILLAFAIIGGFVAGLGALLVIGR